MNLKTFNSGAGLTFISVPLGFVFLILALLIPLFWIIVIFEILMFICGMLLMLVGIVTEEVKE